MQIRSGAWDGTEKMLGAVEHRRIHGVTRQTNKVGTSSSLGPARSKRRRDGQCIHGLEKTQRCFSSQPATCSPGPLISQRKKKTILLLTGQEHAWLSCRPCLHDLPQPATTQPARAEAAGKRNNCALAQTVYSFWPFTQHTQFPGS